MAKEIEITIYPSDLGPPDDELGIKEDDLKLFDTKANASLVQVFVDGKLTDPTKASEKSITVKRPSSNDETSTVVVATKRDKILNVLKYDGGKKIAVEGPADDKSALINALKEATVQIVGTVPKNERLIAAISQLVAALNQKSGAGRQPPNAGAQEGK